MSEVWVGSSESDLSPTIDPKHTTAVTFFAGDANGYYQGIQSVIANNGSSFIGERDIFSIDLCEATGRLINVLHNENLIFNKIAD